MLEVNAKAELQNIIIAERALIKKHYQKIKDAEEKLHKNYTLPEHRKYIGKCYKYYNSNSGHSWWMYSEVVGITEEGHFIINYFDIVPRFLGKSEEITVHIGDIEYSNFFMEQEISRKTFERYLANVIKAIKAVGGNKNVNR